ncbi:hypothetical protein [Bacillus sp. FJAT-50079]|uniref:hypothetical protein n=1 Tax=Bacillus sp. FJAT-50079 TaxID=2833577 RepID=UPI001BC9CA40|nr:hypothetical protein [Bacillus sp. FJAT-50079]MBS4209460.1 hypothetical protein [Bacillus sp. FJAT-50079]
MNLKNVIGYLLGAIIAFLIIGLIKGSFNFINFFFFILGALVFYIIIFTIKRKKSK